MRKFSGKYETLLETAIQRYQQGGFLVGDLVKIKKNALSNEKLKGVSEQMKQRIKEFQESDVNLRLSAVKSSRANTAVGYVGGPDAPTDYYVDVVQEINPANWVNPTTLPMEVVEKLDHESWEPVPVPDSLKRMSPEATDFDDKGVSKDDIGADEYSRMSDNLNLPSKNTKLSNSEKWDDSKPGGGNTKDLEKLKKESKDMRKNDNKMLEEAYNNIVVQEAGGWVDRLTSRVGGAVAGAKELIGGGTRGAADAYKLRSQVDYVKKTFEGLKQGMQKMGINPQSLQNIDHMMNQMSSQIEAEILQSGQVAQHAQGQQQRAAQAGQAQATAAGQLAQGAQAAQAGGLAQAWHAQDAVSAQQRAQTANQRWDNAPITQAGQQGNAANPQLASASPSNVQAPTSGPVPQQAQAPGFYQPK